jgi:soluble cytochrome b562
VATAAEQLQAKKAALLEMASERIERLRAKYPNSSDLHEFVVLIDALFYFIQEREKEK